MAIAFVNSASGSADANGTSIAAGAVSHTTGNLTVVGICWTSGSEVVNSVTDTAGNTYTFATGSQVDHSNDHIRIYYAKNITGNASNVVTANLSGNGSFRRIFVHQYSGCDTTSPFDAVSTGSATGTSVTSGNLVTSTADEVIAAFMSSTGAGNSYVAGTNYTLRVTNVGTDSNSEDRIVAATGTYTASFSWTNSQQAWITAASFKAAGGGGTTKDITPSTNLAGAGTFAATVTRIRAVAPSATIAGAGTFAALVGHQKAVAPSVIAGGGTFAASIHRLAAVAPTINGAGTFAAEVIKQAQALVAPSVMAGVGTFSATVAKIAAIKAATFAGSGTFSATVTGGSGTVRRMVSGIAPAVLRLLGKWK